MFSFGKCKTSTIFSADNYNCRITKGNSKQETLELTRQGYFRKENAFKMCLYMRGIEAILTLLKIWCIITQYIEIIGDMYATTVGAHENDTKFNQGGSFGDRRWHERTQNIDIGSLWQLILRVEESRRLFLTSIRPPFTGNKTPV